MFKFLRKYNKWILAVGGTLLMITFLVPYTFTQVGQGGRRNALWATMGPEGEQPVTAMDANRVAGELSVMQLWRLHLGGLEQAGQPTPPLARDTAVMLNQIPMDPGRPGLQPQHWFLLTREAEQAGLVGGQVEANALLGTEEVAADAALAAIRSRFDARNVGGGDDFIRQTLAKARGVARLMSFYRDAPHYSDRRLKSEAQRYFHAVAADLVVLAPTKEQIEAMPMPSAIERAEHSAKYASFEPGEGPRGFGYRLPNRVKIEWLSITAASVRGALGGSDKLNSIALAKHWKQNESLFGKADPALPVPEAVRNDLLRTLTDQTLNDIAKLARDTIRLGHLRLEQRDGWRVIPEGWQDLPLPDLALSIQQEYGVALPTYESSGSWLTAEDAAELPGIGDATSDEFGAQPTPLAELLMNAKELGGDSSMPVQKGLTGPVLRTPDGSVYLFRVLDADAARAPIAAEEVQQAVVDDLRRLAAYDQLAAQVPAIREQAARDGLLATAIDHNTSIQPGSFITLTDPVQLQMSMQLGQTLKPMPTSLPIIGAHEPTVSAIMAFARALPLDRRVADLPLDERTIALPVDDHLAVVVAQLVDQQPVTVEGFKSLLESGSIESLLTAKELGAGQETMSAFAYDALARRHNFVLIRPPVADDGEEAGPAESTPAAASTAPAPTG